MALDAADLQSIRAIVESVIAARIPAPSPLPRLTIEMFAVAVEEHVETIRSKVRVGTIPAKMVFGERPKWIKPAALELFGVTPQEALERLTARNLLPAPSPSLA